MNKEKIMKTAKIFDRILKIMEYFMYVSAGLMIVSAVLLLFVPSISDTMIDSTSVEFGNVQVFLNEGYGDFIKLSKGRLYGVMAAGFITVATIAYGLKIGRQILAPMCKGDPFNVSVAEKLRVLAIVVMASGVITSFVQAYTGSMFADPALLEQLFKEGVVKNIMIRYNFSLTPLFVGGILFLLSYVFEYGEELQQLSDETL